MQNVLLQEHDLLKSSSTPDPRVDFFSNQFNRKSISKIAEELMVSVFRPSCQIFRQIGYNKLSNECLTRVSLVKALPTSDWNM